MASASKPQFQVAQLYQTVIEDVINNVRESFLDDGVDEQVLQELKQIWESKLAQTKAVDSPTIGDRARPPVYTYYAQPNPGQTMIYQTVPQQLTAASQQARMSVSDVYQQRAAGIVLPTQAQQIFNSYQPVTVLQQPNLQQVRPAGGSGQAIVLTSTTQQQKQGGGKSGPSTIIQVDGSNDAGPGPSSSTLLKTRLSSVKRRRCKVKGKIIFQLDGRGDSSSSDDDVDEDDDDDDDDDDEDEDDEDEATPAEEEGVDEEPLNSADDDSDQDASELFDTENVVVCQYDKIHRAKAKWKFNLKFGIMNLQGKDHVFQKASGEADW